MLAALIQDLVDVPDMSLLALRDSRLARPANVTLAVEWLGIDPNTPVMTCLASTIERVDAVWPIAPETSGILESICALVRQKGKILLNTSAEGVRLAASKLLTANRLGSMGVPVVPTALWQPGSARPYYPFPVVIKPDDGVGCEHIRIISSIGEWKQSASLEHMGNWVMQPLMDGESLSLCGIFAMGEAVLLSVNHQQIKKQGNTFVLKGCTVNSIADKAHAFSRLLKQIATAIPELWGYAGVDLIQNDQGLHVLEINPRLTSSYAGLRAALGVNPARLVIDLLASGSLRPWHGCPVRPIEVMWEPS